MSLEGACQELQLSVDQVLEKLADAEAQEGGGEALDPATLSLGRLIQHIVRVHHHRVRRDLPRLAEMASKVAAKRSDRAPELAKDCRTHRNTSCRNVCAYSEGGAGSVSVYLANGSGIDRCLSCLLTRASVR